MWQSSTQEVFLYEKDTCYLQEKKSSCVLRCERLYTFGNYTETESDGVSTLDICFAKASSTYQFIHSTNTACDPLGCWYGAGSCSGRSSFLFYVFSLSLPNHCCYVIYHLPLFVKYRHVWIYVPPPNWASGTNGLECETLNNVRTWKIPSGKMAEATTPRNWDSTLNCLTKTASIRFFSS